MGADAGTGVDVVKEIRRPLPAPAARSAPPLAAALVTPGDEGGARLAAALTRPFARKKTPRGAPAHHTTGRSRSSPHRMAPVLRDRPNVLEPRLRLGVHELERWPGVHEPGRRPGACAYASRPKAFIGLNGTREVGISARVPPGGPRPCLPRQSWLSVA